MRKITKEEFNKRKQERPEQYFWYCVGNVLCVAGVITLAVVVLAPFFGWFC